MTKDPVSFMLYNREELLIVARTEHQQYLAPNTSTADRGSNLAPRGELVLVCYYSEVAINVTVVLLNWETLMGVLGVGTETRCWWSRLRD
jgi:hypothetical protein